MSLKFSTLKRIYLGSEQYEWTSVRYGQGVTNGRLSNGMGAHITYTGKRGNALLRFWTGYNDLALVATITSYSGRRKPLLIYAPLERRTVVFACVMESLGANPCHEFVLLKNYGHVSPLPEGLLS